MIRALWTSNTAPVLRFSLIKRTEMSPLTSHSHVQVVTQVAAYLYDSSARQVAN